MRLQVVIASTRPGRIGPVVGDWFVQQAKAHGAFDVEVTDLAELNLPFHDEPNHPMTGHYEHEHTREWSRIVDAADAIVFVMPEYNYSFSAPLKNALDYLNREWAYKPVAFVSYGGISGGMRAVAGHQAGRDDAAHGPRPRRRHHPDGADHDRRAGFPPDRGRRRLGHRRARRAGQAGACPGRRPRDRCRVGFAGSSQPAEECPWPAWWSTSC